MVILKWGKNRRYISFQMASDNVQQSKHLSFWWSSEISQGFYSEIFVVALIWVSFWEHANMDLTQLKWLNLALEKSPGNWEKVSLSIKWWLLWGPFLNYSQGYVYTIYLYTYLLVNKLVRKKRETLKRRKKEKWKWGVFQCFLLESFFFFLLNPDL